MPALSIYSLIGKFIQDSINIVYKSGLIAEVLYMAFNAYYFY